MQRHAGGGSQRRRSFDDGEPHPNGALSVMFVRLGIAEIGEHAVAHVLGDEPPVALNEARAAPVIGRNRLPHVLGIEPHRHRCGTNEIAEHHGQLTALRGSVAVDCLRDSRRFDERARQLSDGRQ